VTGEGQPVSREYRYCRRCCLHESRRNWMLISALRGQGKNPAVGQRLLAARADAERGVA
jgi:hypothetical protein